MTSPPRKLPKELPLRPPIALTKGMNSIDLAQVEGSSRREIVSTQSGEQLLSRKSGECFPQRTCNVLWHCKRSAAHLGKAYHPQFTRPGKHIPKQEPVNLPKVPHVELPKHPGLFNLRLPPVDQ